MEEILERLQKMQDDLTEIKSFIGERDIMSSHEYCRLRDLPISTLRNWFAKGCPREGNRHVSKKAVDEWRRKTATRQTNKAA